MGCPAHSQPGRRGGEDFRPTTAREQSANDLNGLEADSSSDPSGKSGLVDTLILGL